MILRGELIARDADRPDHRLGGQRAAFEAVNADHCAGTGHLLQLLLKDRWIIGQRLDLIAREGRAERRAVAIGRGLLFVLLDADRRLQALDRQHGHLFVLAAPDPDVGEELLLESGKLRLNGVSAWRQA